MSTAVYERGFVDGLHQARKCITLLVPAMLRELGVKQTEQADQEIDALVSALDDEVQLVLLRLKNEQRSRKETQ